MKLLSPIPTASAYLESLRRDLQDARVLRFVIAYVSDSGITSIGQELLAAALQQPDSFGVASLSCSCGFAPFVGLQALLEPQQDKLKYFVDPVVVGSDGDPDLALVHSKIVYIVRPENKAVIYLGSHNWSGRALGPDAPRNAEATMRFEFDYDPAQLVGQGDDLPDEINRHLLQCFHLGASLPVRKDNIPIFADWYRARCEREKPLPLDEYAVVIGACVTDGAASNYDHLWKALLKPGASIYLPCHVEGEGQILRQRQDRVLLMAWTSTDALETSREPVLLFCKVTRQVAGKDSAFEGTSEGDIENFDLVLRDPKQSARVAVGDDPGEPLSQELNNGQVFEYFELSSVPSTVTAAAIDGKALPKYQSYLQVYEVLLPEWLKQTSDPRAALAREQMASKPNQAVWTAANLALTTNRQVQPEVSKNYRVPEETRELIMGCFAEFFGLEEGQLRVRPVDPNVAPKELVRLAQSRLHYAYIGDAAMDDGDAFYRQVRPGRLAVDLEPMQRGEDEEATSIEPRVQQLYAERLREILENVGIKNPDLTAWEAKPPKRKNRTVETVRLKLFEVTSAQDIPRMIEDVRQRHKRAALTDYALLKELLLLAVSIQDAGLAQSVGRPLFAKLFEDVKTDQTGFFSVLFVRNLEEIAQKHCSAGWPSTQRARSNVRRDVTQFLKDQELGEDRVWQMGVMEYLRGQRPG